MKRIQKMIVALVIMLSCSIFSTSAQIYVTVRPSRPVYVRPVAPSPRHIWIEEDWNGVGDRYEWHGGYWAEPPVEGYYYTPGYWRHSNHGYVWIGGRWGPHHGHGYGHEHGHGHGYGHEH